ncbi:MAG: phosphate/phosphite/phosphonate ABC transporter substrate-binding protein [Candidatus Thiodiazotropha sp. 6PLUC4]
MQIAGVCAMSKTNKFVSLFFCFARVGLLISALAPAFAVTSEVLVLGVHPYRPHSELELMFQPMADFLSQQIERKIEVRIGDSYQSHHDAIINGDVDIAYIGPSLFVSVFDEHVDIPVLARLEVNGKPTFIGKIIVRESSGFHKLEDLKKHRFAFGSPSSTMSHLVPRQMLHDEGIDIDDFSGHHFYNNHNNVALAVLAGDADAGAVKEAIYEKYKERGIVAIGDTAEVSEHLFIASTKLDPQILRKLKYAMLSLNQDNPSTSSVLKPIKQTATALVDASSKDYQGLRDILNALRSRGVKW